MQLHLLVKYKKGNQNKEDKPVMNGSRPFVTIQLPIFNEKYVVERLIDNIVNLNYPKSRYEIHVLDDSTDETIALTKSKVEEYKAKGFHIKHIQREDRQGFKAGALKDAMKYAQGEFIAIFDADFLPKPNFLIETLPHFDDPEIGVVQTRWEHINQNYSILTELQAFQLNVHFTVEQAGREAGNLMLQFNGTAGVWRRETIDAAGGWEADTLTEDLDLSYRAQLKGWKIAFLEDIVSPAELPAEINGLKSQQFRWMKGGAETAKKMLPTVWKSDLKLEQKLHASSHLLASSVFLCIFAVGVFSVPLGLLIGSIHIPDHYFFPFIIGLLSVIMVYYVANVQSAWPKMPKWKMILKFIFIFPIFLSLSMGLSLHNSIAVLQGLIGKQTAFIRTPKFNIKTIGDSIKKKNYLQQKLPLTTIFEGLFCLYFLFGAVASIYSGNASFSFLHILLFVGYGSIFYLSVKHLRFK